MRSRTTRIVGKLSLMAVVAATVVRGQVTESVIHNFPSPAANPFGPIARDSAGNIYGVSGGGKYSVGVAFKIDSSGNYGVLHTFTDGGLPNGVSVDAAGNVYGTTSQGGKYASGTVFEIDSTGHYSVLYTFTGGADGGHPQYGVTPAAGSMIYGTTPYGGGGA